jgi:CheY-like chemotaxis protein
MGIQVLIVDDSPTTRMVIERIVRMADSDVDTCHHASNGEEALRILETHWLDLVFTDIHMNGMDGRELLHRIRASEIWKNIPVAVITSERSDETEVELVELGANAYRKKPLTPESLLEIFTSLKELMP